MSRLSDLDPQDMTAAQRRVYDDITAGPRGGIRGPFNALLRCPGIADHAQKLGAFIRYESSLPGKLRELAILVTARHWTAQYEWYAHAKIAREEGLDDRIIEAIANRTTPEFGDDAERTVHAFCTEALKCPEVSDGTYATALELLGETGVVELVGLMGYYCLVALTLNTFRVPLPADAKPLS